MAPNLLSEDIGIVSPINQVRGRSIYLMPHPPDNNSLVPAWVVSFLPGSEHAKAVQMVPSCHRERRPGGKQLIHTNNCG